MVRGLVVERDETVAQRRPEEAHARRLIAVTPELPAGVAWFSRE
jgi:hypothetical protein